MLILKCNYVNLQLLLRCYSVLHSHKYVHIVQISWELFEFTFPTNYESSQFLCV